MRTVRSSNCLPGGVYQEGVTPSDAPVHAGIHPPRWTDWQTGVKTLPCRNYVADGNNGLECKF